VPAAANGSVGSYLIGSVTVGANTTLQLDGALLASPDVADYPLVQARFEGEFVPCHRGLIWGEKADHISIVGKGAITGPPPALSRLRRPRGPDLLEFRECNDVTLDGFTTHYQGLWNIHPLLCDNFTARNLSIRSTGANSDGIDVDSCSGVLIENCDIQTGDDCIAIKSGRGLSALKLDKPAENIEIRNCNLSASLFAAVAIGTELSGGIKDIHVHDCTLSGHQNAIFIKSRDGRGGIVDNLNFENLQVHDSPTLANINMLNKGIQASDPVPGDVDKWTRVHNVTFANIQLNKITSLLVATDIPPAQPVDGLTLTNISGTVGKGITLANMKNVTLSKLSVTGFSGSLISTNNVQGAGLESGK
jgi:polygalacturonase